MTTSPIVRRSVDEVLAGARARLTRLTPAETEAACRTGAPLSWTSGQPTNSTTCRALHDVSWSTRKLNELVGPSGSAVRWQTFWLKRKVLSGS